MSAETNRRPLRVNRCEKNEDPKEMLKRRIVTFLFMALVLFLWYYSTINIETFITMHADDMVYSNVLNAINSASVLIVYIYFIYEVIKPSKFSLWISTVVLSSLFAFLIFTLILVNF